MDDKRRGELAGLYRPVQFPEKKRFMDLFQIATYIQGSMKPRTISVLDCDKLGKPGPLTKSNINVGPYCSVTRKATGYGSLYVVCADDVLDYLQKRVVASRRDSISFACIERDDGVLVLAKNSLILADYWLALIDPASLPSEVQP